MKIFLIILISAIALALIVFITAEYIRPALQRRKYKGFDIKDSPTAKYGELMPDADKIYALTEELMNMGARLPGTKAGEEAQKFVFDKFKEYGLEDVKIRPSETDLWQCDEYSLTIDGEDVPAYFITQSFNTGEYGEQSTPDGGIEAELVYVGDGNEKDFANKDVEGKIVICNARFSTLRYAATTLISKLIYDPKKTFGKFDGLLNPYSATTFPYNYHRAMERGARGCIVILTDYIESPTYNNEDYSWVKGPMKIPGFWVTRRTGEKIVNKINAGVAPTIANMKMACSRKRVKAGAVTGVVRGNSGETVLVHSHYDSSTPGATEDGTGMAEVLALAEFYASIPKQERKRSIMFMGSDTHFSNYDTHEKLVADGFAEENNIIADVCIEHVASEMKNEDGEPVLTGEVETRIIFVSESDKLEEIACAEVVRHDLERTMVVSTKHFADEIPTDADILCRLGGVPIISMVSGQLYLYDEIDTMDKVPKEELVPVEQAFADMIWRLMKLEGSVNVRQ